MQENLCFSGTNQKAEWRRPFGTGLGRHCPQGLFLPFFTFLRAMFFLPFRLSLTPTICPWVSEDGEHISLGICRATHIPLGICISWVREHITRDMSFPGRGAHVIRGMCFLGRGTHFTRNKIVISWVREHISLRVCFPDRETDIARDMCCLGGGTVWFLGILSPVVCFSWVGITTRDMCFLDRCFVSKGTHITRDMCFPGRGSKFHNDMCFWVGEHISLVICSSQTPRLVLRLCLPCRLLSLIFLLLELFLTTLLIRYNPKQVGFLWFIGLIPRNGFYMAAYICLSSMNLPSY